MKRFHRHAEHARAHEKQSRRLIRETVLLGLEGHPAGPRIVPNPAAEAETVVVDLREPIAANDLFIAAHARALGLTLVSNNTTEFEARMSASQASSSLRSVGW